ncbi:Ankyrin repeat-containing domain [Pseudocohnilembus persalinus]|uniref:Ankyrin repeat-containing domain n=1 Tax=Pseudocohnilembus persalinus TaxID=266149 RepID=A0A0V0Q7X2_PSEPJ|nr:Ankyrin repeat-containing domain [Pseudocohnilembus persalinus]|eukprot:KRW98286.1 Ankyrin repeat-containing domain [Pseudocohnilembus persalinus]
MQKELSTDNLIFIVKKFQKQGFEGLSLSDLAVAVSIPEFRQYFTRYTGKDWATIYEIKALEKLQKAHFDMQWMLEKEQQYQKPFFLACNSGDLQKVKDILKKSNDQSYKSAVDRNHKNGLHIASEQGHNVLVEFLLMQGFNPNARDKALKTPLHYACTKGHEYIVNLLIQQGADYQACDGYNRTCLHYACCSPNSHVVILLVGMCPDLVNQVDNNNLTPIHYAVLNNSVKQIEILRTLLENGGNVNARDNEGKTCLWYASHQGKSRIIPILLKNNADINISDYENLQTPLDVAANQRTRELLIVYSQNQTAGSNLKQEDINWMNKAIKGEKVDKKNLFDPKLIETQTLDKTYKDDDNLKNQQTLLQTNKTMGLTQYKDSMSSLSRERFFQMMKKIQEEGIRVFQHVKKPYIYTGSWMEGVQKLGDLYTVMADLQATEAVLCVFNLLCPYDKPLPEAENQEVIDGFYGDPWKMTLKSPLEEKLEKERKLQAQLTNIDQLKKKLQDKEKALTNTVFEMNEIKLDNQNLREQLEKLQNQQENHFSKASQQDLQLKENEVIKLKKQMAELKQELKEKNLIIATLESQQNGDEEMQDNAQNLEKIIHLEVGKLL